MAISTSPYKLATDSPSRQLLWELSQIAISSQQGFYDQLDRESSEREALHKQALERAAAEHERVRRSAEHFREQLELQVQDERRKREEAAERELEKQRRESAAAQAAAEKRAADRIQSAEIEARRAVEFKEAELHAAEQRRAEREREDAEAAKRAKESQEIATQKKQQTEAAEAKAKAAAVEALQARSAPAPQPLNQLPPTASTNPKYEAEHARYVEIHRNLKDLRKFMASQTKGNAELKKAMGEMRREIKKNVGQIREGKGTNKSQLRSILETLKKASSFPEPTVNITMFLASPPTQTNNVNGPALLVYLLNISAKALIAQLIDEAGVKPQMADNVGTVASHIFTMDNFRWQGISLIDILLAKMHVVCPVLFGNYGDEQSVQGKERLGWWRDKEDGASVPELVHFQRMTGLGAGYAALSLRNYEKVDRINPFPEYHYWQALSRITSIPPNQITQTHFVVLKGMIGGYEEKFLQFYGDAAVIALRHALVELPKRSPPSVASKALAGLADVLRKDRKLIL